MGHKVWSPKPISCETNRVIKLLDPSIHSWNMQLVNSLFLPFEVAQISQIPLPLYAKSDSYIREGNKDGEFSVRLGYHKIKQWEHQQIPNSSNVDQIDELWKKKIGKSECYLSMLISCGESCTTPYQFELCFRRKESCVH